MHKYIITQTLLQRKLPSNHLTRYESKHYVYQKMFATLHRYRYDIYYPANNPDAQLPVRDDCRAMSNRALDKTHLMTGICTIILELGSMMRA